MPPRHHVHVSATEIPHFRRLVRFVDDVGRHADEQSDEDLQMILRDLRIDLLHLMRGDETEDFDA